MLTRRFSAKLSTGALVSSRRYDHDRWYGHVLELDTHNYKFTGDAPLWMQARERTEEETKFAKSVLPHIDFATTYECLLWDADRLNPHLNRKEFGNEVAYRLEKQSSIVARAQQIVKDNSCNGDLRLEDIQIARIVDEEHVQAEMKYVKCIRANELAEDNRLDILPGGSPNSLREKARWNLNCELHPIDRAEIATRLMAWLPEKYHIIYFDDFQTVAANDPEARKKMLAVIDRVKEDYKREAEENGWQQDLQDTCAELYDDVDPTRNVTAKAISECTSLDELERWSRLVHEYNGDSRMFDIYERAAELTKNPQHQQLVKNMREWYAQSRKI